MGFKCNKKQIEMMNKINFSHIKQKFIKLLPLIRVFTSDKLVKSKLLNYWGLQVFRMKLAQKIYTNRRVKIPAYLSNDFDTFDKLGVLQYDNFLNKKDFDELKNECELIKQNENWKKHGRKDGPNMIYILDIFSLDIKKYPAISNLLTNEKLTHIFSVVERRPIDISNKEIIVQFQYLIQGLEDGTQDPETDLHTDTFFNTHKAWLYMNDVDIENGPFVFVPKTHNIFLNGRLEKERMFSIDINSKGSRRIKYEELENLKLTEKIYTCKENTLLLANTLGYHRRMRGEFGFDRLTIAFSARFNPFFK